MVGKKDERVRQGGVMIKKSFKSVTGCDGLVVRKDPIWLSRFQLTEAGCLGGGMKLVWISLRWRCAGTLFL